MSAAEEAVSAPAPPPPGTPGETIAAAVSENDSFFEMLGEGFAALREHQYAPSDAQIQLDSTPEFLRHAIVNFIDPTAAAASSIQFSPGRQPSASPKASLELYEKLAFVLRSEYNSTLKRVPYTNFRSGANGVIDSLKLKTYMTGSQGGLISISEDSNIPWADTGSVTGQGADPSEWHKGPYCHVYLAACESLEHYRTKVKPSINAFLSQIDAVAKYNVGGKDAVEMTGSQYVIVFVPTGDKSKNTEEGGARGPGGGGKQQLGIWASAKQRMAAREAAAKEERDAGAGQAASNNNNDSVELDDFTASGQNSLTSYLARMDREIMRRLSNDFSAGIVCQLSTLCDVSEDDLDVELKKLEWSAFLKGLGTAITNGFRERCRKYDEELRKLDQLRGVSKQAIPTIDRFDYSSFFLVKESLAFSYQQLNIPSEASLQYDELQAIIPEMRANAKAKPGGALFAFSANGESPTSLVSFGAMSEDPSAFRKRLRSVKNLQPLAHIIQQYIFARQTELSFKMKRPMEVVEGCLSFVQKMYTFKRDLALESTGKADPSRAESWAFHFCWDVKKACEKFYSDGTESISILDHDGAKASTQTDRALASCMCELLSFARARFLAIGDIKLPANPVRTQVNILTQGHSETWKPWTPMAAKSALDEEDDDDDDEDKSESFAPALTSQGGNLLQESLESLDSYLAGYLELLKMIEATNRSAERYRTSARIAIEMAGIHVYRNDLLRATFALKAASGIYAKDHWEITGFLILLRLASYQRRISSADEYVATLVQCFSPAIVKSAPPKAVELLQTDFEAVLRSSLVSRRRFQMVPVFDPVIGLEGLKPNARNLTNRDILKKVYVVGDKAKVTLVLHSALPREIEVDEISVDLVPFRTYVSVIEESKSGHGALDFDEDRMQVLRLRGLLKVSPGKNEFSIDWYPRSAGQFVLASVSVKWYNIRFSYVSKEMKRPTIRVDILPASPTQCVALSPAYLLQGHTQPVTITFCAGSDIINGGLTQLACSGGLSLLPPGESAGSDGWVDSYEADMGYCAPGEKVDITVLVKSNLDKSQDDMAMEDLQALKVTVTTRYQAPRPDGVSTNEGDGEGEVASFETHEMSSQAETLAKKAITMESHGMDFYSRDKATVHLTMRCNTPSPLIIKSWKMSLPSFSKLAEGGDLNSSLHETRLEQDEQMTLAFSCLVTDSGSDTEGSLSVEFEDTRNNTFAANFSMKFSRPTGALTVPDLGAIQVKVSPSASDGNTLEPVTISYEVDTSALASLTGSLKYKLLVDPAAWILSGQREGLIAERGGPPFTASVVAIPTRPGEIKCYPELVLHYFEECKAGEMIPLRTDAVVSCNAFRSTAAPKHSTVAVPMSTKVGKV